MSLSSHFNATNANRNSLQFYIFGTRAQYNSFASIPNIKCAIIEYRNFNVLYHSNIYG